MKNYTLAATAAAALSAAVLGLAAPAFAAPTGGDAQDVISQFEAQGNRVVVNKQSSAPLDEASVVSVTRGPILRQAVPNATSNGDTNRSVSTQTIYVTVR